MFPACSLGIVASTGGEEMQMGMVLAITPMRMEHRNVTTPDRLAPHLTVEIIQALCPAAHERTQHHRRVLVEGGAEQDRKSTRLNSSHGYISYAVFCLKKKK